MKGAIIPFEALSAFFIIAGLGIGMRFGVKQYQKYENYGKPKRWNVDKWDRRMMERDSRLTGNVNIQSDEVVASEKFKFNSALELERPFF
ncbi:hypothetical protein HDU92_001845 [Lobulomyces angularis]|nr:hypothetical protein HDU92_001845 [Lobulomyces angularis]